MAQWFRRFVDVFLLFRYYLPLEKVRAFHFYKLESPSPKDALWKVLLKLALWFWRISRFSNCVTLGKGHALSILECFVPSLVEIGSVVLEKYKKKMESLQQRRRRRQQQRRRRKTDKFQSEKLTCAFSLGELKKRPHMTSEFRKPCMTERHIVVYTCISGD